MPYGELSRPAGTPRPTGNEYTVHSVNVIPMGSRSDVIIRQGDHALFGVGTGSGCPSRRRLAEAVSWAAARFEAVDVVHTDLHLDALLEAFGHEREEARRSAARQLRVVRQRIEGALEDVGDAARRVRARPLSDFVEEPEYREVRGRTREALRTDMALRAVRDRMAYGFLSTCLRPGALPTAAQVQAALDHADAELPFFVDSPRILRVASSVHCCATALAPGRLLLCDRAVGLRPTENQGYAVVAFP